MSNMHRIQWFDQQIREGNFPNSSRLAEQFEISKRQAQRDIEYMEFSLHAPLQYVAQRRGYVYEDKTYVLPLLYMTEEEKKVLKFLAHRYRQYNYENAAVVNRIAYLLDRFTEEDEDGRYNRLPVFEVNPMLLQNFELFSQAIRDRLIVHIAYHDQAEDARFRIWPLKLVSRYNADYVVAYCEQSRKERAFRLDGIGRAAVTNETFEHADVEAKEDQAISRKKPFIAKVLLEAALKSQAWNGYPARPVAGLLYEIEFYDADSFIQHLLVTEWKRLLSPKWLRAKMREKCSGALERLNEDDGEQA
ncbi:WYL domain-containing protein [Paenibacillus mesophilus]|uniref:helix-turn-helix transcriptional regulator n=1 Tax=Paenibacillus mesophilus TaxID=2582849 RepID=UPI00110F5738|nr:WYL domain-containing protein [Paenibacillus mesophilus]TMV49979.1 WYL domain-containing protein [Paenibacillus mesophilus]